MSYFAPFFSVRARERRAARAALRKELPGSAVELVLPYPLAELAPGEFRQPVLLTASGAGVGIQSLGGSKSPSTPWSGIPPITVEYAPEPTPIPVMVVAGDRYIGVHGSGTVALSVAQLRRMVKRIERRRPA